MLKLMDKSLSKLILNSPMVPLDAKAVANVKTPQKLNFAHLYFKNENVTKFCHSSRN